MTELMLALNMHTNAEGFDQVLTVHRCAPLPRTVRSVRSDSLTWCMLLQSKSPTILAKARMPPPAESVSIEFPCSGTCRSVL